MNEPALHEPGFARIPTGIKGLDRLLNGGFLNGGVYLLMGPPGSGKTIVANQLGFNYVARGGRVLYVTLLAESHSRMFGNLRSLDFFSEEAISDSINYLGAYQVLEKDGPDGLLKLLSEAVRKFKASLLFVDGIASAEEVSKTPLIFKKFVHQLNSVLSTSGCTTFLLSSLDGAITHPEHTMVDGIISLTTAQAGMRSLRQIEIKKFRGSSHLQGTHFFRIGQEGVSIYPRIETFLGNPLFVPDESEVLKPLGIPKLDKLLGGGVICGTVTSLLGPAGAGKTSLGQSFLAEGARKGEAGLYFGLYESPQRIVRKMERIGVPLAKHVKSGAIELLWHPRLESVIDEMVDQLLDRVRARKASRLFIDGVGALREGMFSPDRMHRAMAALANELRAMEVTTFLTEETAIYPTHISSPISDLSAVTDNVFFLRHVEIHSELHKVISVLKTRESRSNGEIHELLMGPKGLDLGRTFPSAESLMLGKAGKKKR